MTTFQVQPSTPYNISIGAPGVAGTPSPTITYAWTYNGTAIGTNSRFVNGYTFPSFPGTLACTITLTNIVGSVSQTVTASIQQASNLPTLSPVTIRNNAAPTVPITGIGNGNAGVVLRVGGPNAPDLNPVAANVSSIAYQWRRGALNIEGQTSQTYTLVAADEDETITCAVTASNPDGSVVRVASVRVGTALPNAKSHIGDHAPKIYYVESGVAFTNLIYPAVAHPGELVRGINGEGKLYFGTTRFEDWTGPAYYTADGWPFRSDLGALSESNSVEINLCWDSWERMWSFLGLRGVYQTPPVATLNAAGDRATYTNPNGIAGRTFSYKVTCYWEGHGIAVANSTNTVPARPAVTTVQFAGPDGQGPYGDGPRTMSKSTVTLTASEYSDRLIVYITESDVTGQNPLRNLIVLVSDVEDNTTGEIIYAGFDHTTYKPFQLYPEFVESMRHCAHVRSLHNELAHGTPTAYQLIHDDTGLEYQWHQESHGATHLLTTGWSRPSVAAPGFEKGFAAINRPTHVGFSRSLRAMIEICNQLDADLWWCHPAPTVFVGSRAENGDITYARLRGWDLNDPNTTGEILADEDYVDGFTNEIEQHLKPGLKVYSEWVNEVWNNASNFRWATRYGWASGMRAIASVEYGGDGGLFYAVRTLQSPAIYAGTVLEADGNRAMVAFSAAAGAKLAEGIRARLGSGSSREIVCVAAGQSVSTNRSANGLGQLWAAMPKLFKQVDAVAHAPYRSWWGSSTEQDDLLAQLGAEGAWQYNEEVRGTQQSYAEFPSLALRSDSRWATALYYPFFLSWKGLALDHPDGTGYERRRVPPGWPVNKRRWNLKLLSYEGGNHHIPVSAAAKLESFPGTLHPSYEAFTLRYMETVFGHGPKGVTRDPENSAEEAVYRPGMVPMGVVENAEPLHDRFTFLLNASRPSFRWGMFWGLRWWNGHSDSPQYEAARTAADLGLGEPEWWLNYSGDSQ